MKKILITVLVLTFTLSFNAVLFAQTAIPVTETPDQNMSRAAQYYIGDTNELMMKVNIWGRVLKPGQYFVPSTTDLITLISVAGGPADKSRMDNVRIVRSTEGGSEVIEVNIKKYLKTGDAREIPQLKPEDTIIVTGSMWYLASQIVTIVSQLAIVANVYYWLVIKGA